MIILFRSVLIIRVVSPLPGSSRLEKNNVRFRIRMIQSYCNKVLKGNTEISEQYLFHKNSNLSQLSINNYPVMWYFE